MSSPPTYQVTDNGVVVVDMASIPGNTSGEKLGSFGGTGNLEMLDVVKLLETSGITCCMVGVGALRYYGAGRVLHTWEVCVPSDSLQRAVQMLTSPPYDQLYEQCPHEPIQVFSIHHTLHFFKFKGFTLQFYLVPSDDCHLECVTANIERSQTGLPYPKLDVFAQSLLDTMDKVALTDLVDGMDLDNEWASNHLDLSGTQDIAWTKIRNYKIRASAPGRFELGEEPRSARAFWEMTVSTKGCRIGIEIPPGVLITRFRVIGSGDPRLEDRYWI